MKEGLLSFLNLEDEKDASKLHLPSSMRSYKLQHTYKQMSNSSILYIWNLESMLIKQESMNSLITYENQQDLKCNQA